MHQDGPGELPAAAGVSCCPASLARRQARCFLFHWVFHIYAKQVMLAGRHSPSILPRLGNPSISFSCFAGLCQNLLAVPGVGEVPRCYKSVRGTAPMSSLCTQVGSAALLGRMPSQPRSPLGQPAGWTDRLTALSRPPPLPGTATGQLRPADRPHRGVGQGTQPPQPPSARREAGAPEAAECRGVEPQQGSRGCSAQTLLVAAFETTLK